MGYYVGIDLGGTNVAVGIVDENYNIIGRANVRTKAALLVWRQILVFMIRRWASW